jgi:hypothetical protein
MLFVLPVALIALAFGRWMGLVAGVVGVFCVVAWLALDPLDLGVIGWLSRTVPLLLIGLLVGDAADRLRIADSMRVRATEARVRQAQAANVNDSLVQGMAAAKWQLESGRYEDALSTLELTIDQGQQMVSELLRQGDDANANG